MARMTFRVRNRTLPGRSIRRLSVYSFRSLCTFYFENFIRFAYVVLFVFSLLHHHSGSVGITVFYILALIFALVVLVWSARMSVDRMIGIAHAFVLPDVLIAMSIISVGTSLPEICSGLVASAGILSETLDPVVTSHAVVGSNMGSSTIQQFLLMGILVLGIGDWQYERSFFGTTYVPMLLCFVLLFGLALDGTISRVDGGVMVLVFSAYMYMCYHYRPHNVDVRERRAGSLTREVMLATAAFIGVMISAYVCLTIVERGVETLQLKGSLVGMITIGFASALPEFSTVIESIRRRNPDLGMGTLVGSNVVNTIFGLGLGSMISTYAVPVSLLYWDLPFKFLVGLLFLGWMYFIRDRSAGGTEGVVLVVVYAVYLSVRVGYFL